MTAPTLATALSPDGTRCTLTPAQLKRLSKAHREALWHEATAWLRRDQRENQLRSYTPVSPDARRLHLSTAWEIGVQGGRKSGKTGTMLAELAIQMTGQVPESLPDYPRIKVRPPIRARLVVSSLTSAWDNNLKQKLQWYYWNGKTNADRLDGDDRLGHFGWIPKRWLLGGAWEEAWSERHRILTLNAAGDGGRTPGSTLQLMSWEQDISEFNQGAFHLIVEDELPPEEIHRANRLRTMELGGRLLIGGTPPDSEAVGVTAAWFFDQVLAPGLDGSNPDEVFAIALWTEHNRTLDERDVEKVARGLTPAQRRASLHGETLHLAGLIYPGWREKPGRWCFTCHEGVRTLDGACVQCGTAALTPYSHAWDDGDVDPDRLKRWPVVSYMDPHQSRQTAIIWLAVDPMDQAWQLAELEVSGDATVVKAAVDRLEAEREWAVVWRKGDPKITAQANQFAKEVNGEPFNIRRAFEDAGLFFEEAETNFTVGRQRVLDAMRVNPLTKAPGLRAHRSCVKTHYQLSHFTWNPPGKDGTPRGKDEPSRRNSDFPACVRYFCIDQVEHRQLERTQVPRVIRAGKWAIGGARG